MGGFGSLIQTASSALEKKRQREIEEQERASEREMAVLRRALMQAQIDKINAPPEPDRPMTVAPGAGLYDPSTRTFIREPGSPQGEKPSYTLREGIGPDGNPGVFRVNTATGQAEPVSGMSPAPSSMGGQVAGQRQVLAKMAQDALTTLEGTGQKPPSLIEQAASSPIGQTLGGQYVLGEKRQVLNQAADQFSEAVLRFATGAQAPEHEKRSYVAMLTVRAGDKPALIERKRQAQRTILQGLQALAQRGDVNPDEAVSILQQAALSVGGPAPSPSPAPAGRRHDRFLPRP